MAGLAQNIEVFSKALNLRTQRHQILASNIANADTPGYKARDMDFAKAMQGALAGRGDGAALARTSSGHMDGSGGAAFGHLQYRKETQSAVDGNTVDMDVERAQISENAVQYQVLTRLIGDRLQSMRTAISSNQG
ncbi:MAG: flgB [Proteobacteria bacterium]|nr:flgB [Pseudomonadota bacterium]